MISLMSLALFRINRTLKLIPRLKGKINLPRMFAHSFAYVIYATAFLSSFLVPNLFFVTWFFVTLAGIFSFFCFFLILWHLGTKEKITDASDRYSSFTVETRESVIRSGYETPLVLEARLSSRLSTDGAPEGRGSSVYKDFLRSFQSSRPDSIRDLDIDIWRTYLPAELDIIEEENSPQPNDYHINLSEVKPGPTAQANVNVSEEGTELLSEPQSYGNES